MKERAINRQRAVVAHHQSEEVAEPGDGAFHRPPPLTAPKGPAVLRRGLATILAMRNDQLDAAPGQLLAQRVTVVATVGDEAFRLLPRTAWPMLPSYADRGECRLRQPDLRRGSRVKVVSQRNTRAVDHHHPLRPDRKSTRLNSSHLVISYAVFCLKKKKWGAPPIVQILWGGEQGADP